MRNRSTNQFDWEEAFYKVLDAVAALCLTFGVDWNAEFPDDDYVVARRSK